MAISQSSNFGVYAPRPEDTYPQDRGPAPSPLVGGLTQGQALGGTQDLFSRLQAQADAREAQIGEMYAPMLSRWDTAAEELRNRQIGPSRTERLFELAASFLQPTKTGTAGTFQNVATTLAGQSRGTRELEEERQRLLQEYGLEQDQLRAQQAKDILASNTSMQDLMFKYQTDMPTPTYDPVGRMWVYPASPATNWKTVTIPVDQVPQAGMPPGDTPPPAKLPADFFGGE